MTSRTIGILSLAVGVVSLLLGLIQNQVPERAPGPPVVSVVQNVSTHSTSSYPTSTASTSAAPDNEWSGAALKTKLPGQGRVRAEEDEPEDIETATRAVLHVSGANADVEIRKGLKGVFFEGGHVSSSNSDSVFYLPPGQRLLLEITGTNADVVIDSDLMPYIEVRNAAVNADIQDR